MQDELKSINFTLTNEMAVLLLEFNYKKKELIKLKRRLGKNDDLQIKKLNKELITIRNKFIKEFRLSNKDQIKQYLDITKNIESIRNV